MYVRDKIIVLPLNRYSLPPHIEILFFELNLNRKWLVCCSYNPHKHLIKEHLQAFTESIHFYKYKWEEKKSRSESLEKQFIEESDEDDALINNSGGNNSIDDLSELGDEMETGSINYNFRNAFYFSARINLHTFLAEQVFSVLSMS